MYFTTLKALRSIVCGIPSLRVSLCLVTGNGTAVVLISSSWVNLFEPSTQPASSYPSSSNHSLQSGRIKPRMDRPLLSHQEAGRVGDSGLRSQVRGRNPPWNSPSNYPLTPQGSLKPQINLECMFLDCGGTLEHLEKTHTCKGEHRVLEPWASVDHRTFVNLLLLRDRVPPTGDSACVPKQTSPPAQ